METNIPVRYQTTDVLTQAKKWLESLPNLVACDFETASKYEDQKEVLEYRLALADGEKARVLRQQLTATGLSHPSLIDITHFNIAWSESDAYVIILPSKTIRDYVLDWIVSTDRTQLWHNALFDLKIVYHNREAFPKSYVDTQLLAKCHHNHANSSYESTGLKDLMGQFYGSWAIAKDEYSTKNMYNEKYLSYCATDACATYKLYQLIKGDNPDEAYKLP